MFPSSPVHLFDVSLSFSNFLLVRASQCTQQLMQMHLIISLHSEETRVHLHIFFLFTGIRVERENEVQVHQGYSSRSLYFALFLSSCLLYAVLCRILSCVINGAIAGDPIGGPTERVLMQRGGRETETLYPW